MSIFSKSLIKLNYISHDKDECLKELSHIFYQEGFIDDEQIFFDTIMERENLVSTGMGRGIAIPHARTDVASEIKILVCLLDTELDFDSLDGKPVEIIFMLSVPKTMKNEYMKVLGFVSKFLSSNKNRENLFKCKNEEEVLKIIGGIENEITI